MKKKIFNILFAIVMIIPCLMLTACGSIKSLEGETFVFSKITVTGSISKSDYENDFKNHKFVFSETEVVFYEGLSAADTYDYKFENGKLYIKAKTDADYSNKAYAETDGKYLVISQTVEGGIVKVYFKS